MQTRREYADSMKKGLRSKVALGDGDDDGDAFVGWIALNLNTHSS